MIQSPINNVLLQIGDAFVRRVSDMINVSMMYGHGSDLNPADLVQIVGRVVGIPASISDRGDYKGFSVKDIEPGDMAIFRYDVVYSFTGDKQRFKNMFYYEGVEYWLGDIQKIFAVIRENKIVMINGYCMIENMSNPSAIILPLHMKSLIQTATATLTQIGNNLTHLEKSEAKAGDTVYYNPAKLQTYEMKGKKFGIIRQKDIMGLKIGGYSELVEDLSWKR